jgi:hypothetical protein
LKASLESLKAENIILKEKSEQEIKEVRENVDRDFFFSYQI